MCLLVAPKLMEVTPLTFEPVSVNTISGRSPMRRQSGLVLNSVLTSMFPSHFFVTPGDDASL